jgi:isopropylmalate/homocitrate/citramalate synthase
MSTEPANVLTQWFQSQIHSDISLRDVTLRDGEQTPNVAFTRDEKLELARALDELGVPFISVGFPAVSDYELETARQLTRSLKATTFALSRPLTSDIDAVARAGAQVAGLFVSLSDWHLRDKLRSTEEEVLQKIGVAVPHARKLGLRVHIGVEDGTRTPLPRLVRFIRAFEEMGCEEVDIADTVGILVPEAARKMAEVLVAFMQMRLAVHFHNDLGMATANALAALAGGAKTVDVSVAGLGERCGNTSLEELAVVLKVKYGVDLGLQLDKLPSVTAMAARFAGLSIPPNKPIVGENVFSHESGIHVAGILATPITYEPFPPALVGRRHQIIYGKHSGLTGVRYLLKREKLELDSAGEELLLARIKEAGQSKERLTEAQVLDWARAAAGARP